jgi:hypothetical protein
MQMKLKTRRIVFSPLPSKKNIPLPKPWSFFPSLFYIVYAYCFHKCSIFILLSLNFTHPFFHVLNRHGKEGGFWY